MSLPLLPEPIYRYYNWQTESSLPSYSADQMREIETWAANRRKKTT